jgi:O-antigen/teichoic acid export membrane protein
VLNSNRHPRLTLAATQVLCEGSALLRNIVIARLIGADEMGLAVALALGIRIFEMAGELGLDRLLVQVEKETLDATRRAVHLLQLVKGWSVAGVAALLAIPVCLALDPAINPAWFALAAVSIAVRGSANWDYRERQRYGEFLPALVVEGGSNLIAVLAAIPLALWTRDYSALVWVSLLQASAFFALSHAVASRPLRVGFDRALLARCVRYGAPIALNGALMFLALQGDRLIAAVHFPAAELARFALAAQLALLPALIGARYVLTSELPRFAALARQPHGFEGHLAGQLTRVTVVASLGVVGLGLCGNLLVEILYGSEYRISGEVFWLLAAAAGLRLIRAVPSTALMALERTRLLLLGNLPRLLILPIALIAVANGGGLVAVVACGAVGEALCLVVALIALAASRPSIAGMAEQRLAEGV